MVEVEMGETGEDSWKQEGMKTIGRERADAPRENQEVTNQSRGP
jgi:hypothetical protein